jgi:hypothetical protein
MNFKAKLILFALVISFYSCTKGDMAATSVASCQEIAWVSLSDQEKLTITTEWRNARVEKTTYKNKKVYSVLFNTVDDALLGPIVIFVDRNSNRILGQGFRN